MSAPDARLIRGEAEWEALAGDWERLLTAVGGESALQSQGFLRCWWRHMGRSLEPWIVTTWRAGELVAAAPLQRAHRRIWGREYRVLEFMGMPNELLRPALLAAPGDQAALEAVLEMIAARADEWELLQLDELPRTSWQWPVLESWARRHGFRHRARDFHPCPYLVKTDTWETYLETKSAHFRRRLGQAQRRLARAGALRYDVATSAGELAAAVETFFAVESRSWKARKEMASGADGSYREFCRELLTDAGHRHAGHAIVQRLDGQPTAATIGLALDGVYYSLQIAHDEAYGRYSPGTLLEAFELEWFFAQPGLRRYEFLGGTVFNKRRWTDTAVASCQWFVRRPGWHLALKDLSRFHVQPALAGLWQRLRPGPAEPSVPPFRLQ